MAVQRTPMTRGGYEKLKEELERLKRVERYAITKAIAEARVHGDLSENAEYHTARERQSFVEGRIAELKTKPCRARAAELRRGADRRAQDEGRRGRGHRPADVGRARHVRLDGAPRGRARQGIPLPDRRLRRGGAGPWEDLDPRAARADADRKEGRRHGDGAAARREEDLRDPRGQLPLGVREAPPMPTARVDSVNLFFEEVGAGLPLVFVHEFAGDYRSWRLQMGFFSR